MNLADRRHMSENIHLSPWKLLYKSEDKCYLFKIFFNLLSPSYDIYVTNGIYLWNEKINEEEFLCKCKKSNPNIEATPSVLLKHIRESFQQSIEEKDVTIATVENGLEVGFRSKLMSTIPFSWLFQLTNSSSENHYNEFIHPIVIMLEESFRRQQHLINMVESKDREIQDYKDNGATVSRRHLETLPFDRHSFESKSNINSEFMLNCQSKDTLKLLAKENTTSLYRAVVMNKYSTNHQQLRDELPAENKQATFDTVPVEQTARVVTSWNEPERLPISLLQDNEEEAGTSKQPVKTGLTPEKDVEKERREALRRRLEEETENKKKKKKRKLKI